MVAVEDLEHGLEWIGGKTRIKVTYRHDHLFGSAHLNVYLFPDYPDERKNMYLHLDVLRDCRVTVIDLVGSGCSSGIQARGYGTLIFNTGLQAIYAAHKIQFGDSLAKEIIVRGRVSSIDDVGSESEILACGKRRNGF